MVTTGTKTEQVFANKMEAEDWKVHKNGFPDFLCIKDDKAILVEVKANSRQKLKDHQFEMMTLLANRNLKSFAWSPDNPNLIPLEDFQIRASQIIPKPIPAPLLAKPVATSLNIIKVTGLITFTEAARILGVSRPTLYKRIREGKLHPVQIGRNQYFVRADAEGLKAK